MNEKESEAQIESREIYLNCKQAKCWMDINFKELLTEKADLKTELDNRDKRILDLKKERRSLKIKDEVRLELLDDNEQLRAELAKHKKVIDIFWSYLDEDDQLKATEEIQRTLPKEEFDK